MSFKKKTISSSNHLPLRVRTADAAMQKLTSRSRQAQRGLPHGGRLHLEANPGREEPSDDVVTAHVLARIIARAVAAGDERRRTVEEVLNAQKHFGVGALASERLIIKAEI